MSSCNRPSITTHQQETLQLHVIFMYPFAQLACRQYMLLPVRRHCHCSVSHSHSQQKSHDALQLVHVSGHAPAHSCSFFHGLGCGSRRVGLLVFRPACVQIPLWRRSLLCDRRTTNIIAHTTLYVYTQSWGLSAPPAYHQHTSCPCTTALRSSRLGISSYCRPSCCRPSAILTVPCLNSQPQQKSNDLDICSCRVVRVLILQWPQSWQLSSRRHCHQTGLRPDSLVAATSTLVVAWQSLEDLSGVALRSVCWMWEGLR